MIVELTKEKKSLQEEEIYLNGYLVYNSSIFTEEKLSQDQRISLIALVNDILIEEKSISDFSGSFSIIFKSRNKIYVITDRLGSKRVFYYSDNQRIICSNDFFELTKNLKTRKVKLSKDEVALAEIYCFLYSFNDRTIYQQIKEVNSSTILEFNFNRIKQYRYWRWRQFQNSLSFNESLERASASLKQVQSELEMLISHAELSSFITLSGGGDSRLVLSLLQNNIDDRKLTAIILGQLASHDVRVAYKIANELKLKVLYSPIVNYEELPALEKYEKELLTFTRGSNIIGSNIFSLLQNNPTIKSGLHLNGHMGDILGGSHISLKEWLLHLKGNYNSKEFIFRVFQKHSIFHLDNLQDSIKESIAEDLLLFFKNHPNENNLDIIESFDIEHRQRKYILNDNQSFSALNLIPTIPLGQKDFIQTFSEMNNRYRYGSKLYNHLKYNRFHDKGYPYTSRYGDSITGPTLPKESIYEQILIDLRKVIQSKIFNNFSSIGLKQIPKPLDGKIYFYGLDNYFEIRKEEYIKELEEISKGIFKNFQEKDIKAYGILTLLIPQFNYLKDL